MRKIVVGCLAVLWVALTPGCGSDENKGSQSGQTGSMDVKVGIPIGVEVNATIAVRDVFDPANTAIGDCQAKPYPLPGDGAFCDSLLVLPPGLYEVVVQPDDTNCRTEQPWYKVVVQPNQTTEVHITITCGPSTGGLDVIVTEEFKPVIIDVNFFFKEDGPANKFVCRGGKPVVIAVTVFDKDTPCDELTVAWHATMDGMDKTGVLFPFNDDCGLCVFTKTINPWAPMGEYEVTFSVSDPQGNSASLTFPVYLIPCPGVDP